MKNIEEFKQFNEERFTKVDIIKRRKSRVFLLNFLPKQEMRQHNHPNRELYLHVLDGHGTLHINKDNYKIKKGDVIYCSSDEQIGFTNTSEAKVTIYASMTEINE